MFARPLSFRTFFPLLPAACNHGRRLDFVLRRQTRCTTVGGRGVKYYKRNSTSSNGCKERSLNIIHHNKKPLH